MIKECKSCSKEPQTYLNIPRFIQKMDDCFARNDLDSAVKTVRFWESEARTLGDNRGLLSVLNEQLGLFRRLGDKVECARAVEETEKLLSSGNFDSSVSVATVYINLATSLSSLGMYERALAHYETAESVYLAYGRESTYEYATLLNNKSNSLASLAMYASATDCLNKAIGILDEEGRHDADIALSYLALAELRSTRNEDVEPLLDTAWEYINSERNSRDSAYAFAIKKCAPFYRLFGREMEADALEAVADDIYRGV